ncbi:hypothetical protein C7271_10385 [filamentous cyanobacterium CCP5]|nr:hypothetical protein C7271_10385 [filamentous cyanobacterium CCP5]
MDPTKNSLGYKVSINSTLIIQVLALVYVALFLLSATGQIMRHSLPEFPFRDAFIDEFNLNAERNIPALFSTLLLIACACILFVISRVKQQIGRDSGYWAGLSYIFVYLALDEFFSIHELLIDPLRRLGFNSGFLYFPWIIPAIVAVALVGIIFRRFLLRLPSSTRNGFLVAAIVYVGGAIFIESIGGNYFDTYGNQTLMYAFIVSLEESCEVMGVLIFMNTLLKHLENMTPSPISLKLLINERYC